MVNSRLYFGILSILSLGVSACLSPANVEFEAAEQELVVYAHIGPDAPIDVYLTHTRDPLKPNAPFNGIDDATIKLSQDGQLLNTFQRTAGDGKNNDSPTLYTTDIIPQSGSTYSIEIAAEGYKIATAQEKIPSTHPVIRQFSLQNTDNNTYLIEFAEGTNATDFYQLVIKSLKYEQTTGSEDFVLTATEILDYTINHTETFPHFPAQNDRISTSIHTDFAGHLFTSVDENDGNKFLFIDIPDTEIDREGEVKYSYQAKLYNVSESYYRYHESIHTQLTEQNILTDPSRIIENIEGGFGNFSTYQITSREVFLPE